MSLATGSSEGQSIEHWCATITFKRNEDDFVEGIAAYASTSSRGRNGLKLMHLELDVSLIGLTEDVPSPTQSKGKERCLEHRSQGGQDEGNPGDVDEPGEVRLGCLINEWERSRFRAVLPAL